MYSVRGINVEHVRSIYLKHVIRGRCQDTAGYKLKIRDKQLVSTLDSRWEIPEHAWDLFIVEEENQFSIIGNVISNSLWDTEIGAKKNILWDIPVTEVKLYLAEKEARVVLRKDYKEKLLKSHEVPVTEPGV